MPSPLPIQHDFSLRDFNTFGIDVAARAYLKVTDGAMLDAVRADPLLGSLPRLILGGGSNLLLTQDFDGLVLHMANRGMALTGATGRAAPGAPGSSSDAPDAPDAFDPQAIEKILVTAAAGESWHGLVLWTLRQGLGGMENLSLIPGSVGACPIQNIGAYGVEVGNLIEAVRYYDFVTGEIAVLDRAGCEFGYRDSIFKNALRTRAVILDVTFGLAVAWKPNLHYAELAQELAGRLPGRALAAASGDHEPDASSPTASAVSDAVIAIRTRKLPDPAVIGNAGSFFKNPVVSAAQRDALATTFPGLVSFAQADGSFKLAAGWLIDQCGWKGRSLGAAGVYERQALVLVNRGNASGAEIWRLAMAIQADVETRFGVRLEPEPVVL